MRAVQEWMREHWVWLLGLALLLRLAVAPFAYGFQYDMDTFGNWARTLVAQPFDRFYEVAASPDHLPGDLYLHYGLASLFQALGGENFHGEGYRYLLKVVPAVADILIALVIWMIVRRLASERTARLSALLYALNPATIFLSAVWGQWDAVSGLIMLLGLMVVWLRPGWWLASIPLFGWAVMIKPPLALLCLIGLTALVLADLRRGQPALAILRARAPSLLAALIIGLVTIIALILPFDTGLPGMDTRWSLLDRVDVAVDLYPFTTLGAANIWMIPLGSPDRQSDQNATFLGVTEQGWGSILFLAAILYVGTMLLTRWRMIEPVKLTTWAMVVASYAYFLLPTRSHERYLFPTVMLLIVLAGLCRMEPRLLRLSVAVSLVYALNLVGVYFSFPGVTEPISFVTMSLLNVAFFVAVAAFPFWWDHDSDTAGTTERSYGGETGAAPV